MKNQLKVKKYKTNGWNIKPLDGEKTRSITNTQAQKIIKEWATIKATPKKKNNLEKLYKFVLVSYLLKGII